MYVLQVALVVMDEKVQDRVNVLNSARYATRRKQEKLDDLKARRAVSVGGGGGAGGGRGGGGGGRQSSESGRASESGQASESSPVESEDAQVRYFLHQNELEIIILVQSQNIKYS